MSSHNEHRRGLPRGAPPRTVLLCRGEHMRTFFCIPLPDAAHEALHDVSEHLRRRTQMRAAWVRPSNYHITLRFLGEIDPMLTVDLRDLASTVTNTIPPFQCTLNRVGAFPQLERARVVWVGGNAPDGFREMSDVLNQGLIPLGFPRGRRETVAHVTLARIKDRPDPALPSVIEAMNPLSPVHFLADRLVLMQSELSPQGAVYTPLFACALGKEGRDGAD